MLGQIFSNLTVLSFVGKNSQNQRKWLCKCVCGNERIVMQQHLLSGNTRSCGCMRGPKLKLTRPGEKATRKIYEAMRDRCHNSKNQAYSYYGGRGIVVCDRWLASFDAFYSDVGPRPPGLTLDRIDGTKGYEPGNVRWATYKEQAFNKKTTIVIKLGDKEMCLSDACLELGVTYGKVHYRMKRRGMSFEEAVRDIKTPSKI